jgi:hypothetical protein
VGHFSLGDGKIMVNRKIVCGSVLALSASAVMFMLSGGSFAQKSDAVEGVPEPSELMRHKLIHANGILEGLTVNDFTMIEEEAEALSMISLEAHWRTDLPPSYGRYNSDFQWAVGGLIETARLQNLEGSTLKYAQIVMSCVECHSAVRGRGQVASLQRPTLPMSLPNRD